MIVRTGALLAQFVQQGQPVHHRHVDVEQHQLDVGLGGQRRPALPRRGGQSGSRTLVADLAAKALADQRLEIGSSSTPRILTGGINEELLERAGKLPQLRFSR
jgi:hypothetical protein